jgi:hypothetical protein
LHDLATVYGHDSAIGLNAAEVFGWIEGSATGETPYVRSVENALERLELAGFIERAGTTGLVHVGDGDAAGSYFRVTPAGRDYLRS